MSKLILGWEGNEQSQGSAGLGFTANTAPPAKPALITDTGLESHVLVVASTGSGKTRNFVVPQLLSYPGSCVVCDVKGELYHTTQRHRRTLGPVLVIDPFRLVSDGEDALNVLTSLNAEDPSFIDDVYSIAQLFESNLPATGKDGAFWSEWGIDVIAGMIAHVMSSESETDRSLGRVYERLNTADLVYDLAVLLDKEKPSAFTTSTLGKFISLPDVTRGGVLATFGQQLRLLASTAVRRTFATNTIDPSLMAKGEPFTVYVVWPPDKLASHAALIRIFLTGITQILIQRKQRPEHSTLFLVDEAAQLGKISALLTATTLGRGYGIKIAWIFQSIGQLHSAYGQDAQVIIDNTFSALTFGRQPNWRTAQALADALFGDVSVDKVFNLKPDEVMLRMAGTQSMVGRKLDYLKDSMFAEKFDPNPFYSMQDKMAAGRGS